MLENIRILVVDDEIYMRQLLQEILADAGYACDVSENGKQAMLMMDKYHYDIVISDVNMPKMAGMELLEKVIDEHSDTSILLITAYATVSQAVEAIKIGAEDYITKPFKPEYLLNTIESILVRKNAIPTNKANSEGFCEIIGNSPKMQEIFSLIQRVAPTSSTVLIEGESGTGKELIANAIYSNSKRHNTPFIKVNCAAIPSSLMESELFGHVKGAFTGAIKDKKGKFQLAHKGTIYLDEIGDMETALQAKILRVLQEQEITRVGSETVSQVDVRIIAATNKNLIAAVENGEFRDDLYYRLNVINIKVPPLRERREDIPSLIQHFIKKHNEKVNRSITGLSQQAQEICLNYAWPGNIRELENAIERAIILSHSDTIEAHNLPENITHGSLLQRKEPTTSTFQFARNEFEKKMIEKALEETDGNVSKAARILGISRHSLRYQLEKLGFK